MVRAAVGRAASSRLKRGLDIVAAVAVLILVSPVTIMLIVMLRCTKHGPILCRQHRLGLNGQLFKKWCWAQPGNKKLGWGGRLLVKELSLVPALINVLTGQMAFVGPIARTPEEHNTLALIVAGYDRLLTVRPGVIGVGSPRFQGVGRAAEVRCELNYVENWQFFTDLAVIIERALTLPFIKTDHYR